MAARGSYAKGVAKRDEILTTALDVIARNGYHNTSIRELAAAVGLSQTGLLHYFGTKEALFAAVLGKRDEVDGLTQDDPSDDDFVAAVVKVVRHNTDVPGLVQLYAQFSTEAGEPGHPAREYFQERYAWFRGMVADTVRRKQAAGDMAADLDPERIATIMTAVADGMQTQWMLDPSIDMADHFGYLWEQLTSGRSFAP